MSYQRREDIDDMIMELRQEKETDIIIRSRIDMRSDDQKQKEGVEKYEERLTALQLELNIQKTGRKADQLKWNENKKGYESKIEQLMQDLSTLLDQQQFRDDHIDSLKNSINTLYRDHHTVTNELKSCKSKLKEYEEIIRSKELNEQSSKEDLDENSTDSENEEMLSNFYKIYDSINKEDPHIASSSESANSMELPEPQSQEQKHSSNELLMEHRYDQLIKKKNGTNNYENRNPVENLEDTGELDGLTHHYEQQIARKDKHIAFLKHSMDSIRREHEFLSSELLKIRMREIKHKATYKYHKGDVLSLQYYKHGEEKYLASGSLDKSLKIWMPNNKSPDNVVSRLISSIKIRTLTFLTVNGTLLLACGGSNPYKIEVWNVKEKKLQYTLKGHSGTINSILAYEDQENHYLVSASADARVNIWCLKTKRCIKSIKGHSKNVGSLALYSHRKRLYLATGSDDNSVKLWDMNNSYQCICTLMGHSSHVRSLTFFSKNNKMYLASGSYDKTIMIWNLVDNVLEATLNGHSDKIYFMSVFTSNNRPCLLTGGNDRTIRCWDLGNYNEIISLNVPSSLPVWSLTVDNDEEDKSWNLVSGHGGGSVIWWNCPEKMM